MNWYQLDTEKTLTELQTDRESGLSNAEAGIRLRQHGANELVEGNGRNPWRILWEQFTATMVLILIAAAIISGFLGK